MVRKLTVLPVFFIVLFFQSCTKLASTDVASSAPELDAKVASFGTLLLSGGLTESEVSAITSSIASEQASSLVVNSKLISQSLTVDSLPLFVSGAMKALGNSAFSSASRKKLAVQLITSKVLAVFADELSGLSAEELETIVSSAVEAQMKNSGSAGLSGSDREDALKEIINQAILSCDEICSNAEKKNGFVRSLASSAVKFLDETGMSTADISAAIPKIVESAITAVANLSGASNDEKNAATLEFIMRVFENINESGASESDYSTVADNISSTVSTALPSNTQISEGLDRFTNDVKSCSSSGKFVYMFEYSDDNCQTLTKKFVAGPINNSPLGRGYPNHAFCFYDSRNGKYYNWLQATTDCNSSMPSTASIPSAGPSPRNLTVDYSSLGSLKWSTAFHGGGGLGKDSDNSRFCESNALQNFRANGQNHFVKYKFNGVVQATYDTAPSGITYAAGPKACTVNDYSSGNAMHAFYARDERECLDHCRMIISEYPEYDYYCKLSGSTIETFLANTVPAFAPSTKNYRLKWTQPNGISAGQCVKLGLSQVNSSNDSIVAGNGKVVSLWNSTQYSSATKLGKTLSFYSNSTCTSKILTTSLASGAEEKFIYAQLETGYHYLDLVAEPMNESSLIESVFSGGLVIP